MTGSKMSKLNDDFDKEWNKLNDYLSTLRYNDEITTNVYGRMKGYMNLLYAKHNRVLKALNATEAYWIKEKASKFTVVCSACSYESIIWNARYCPGCGKRMEEKHHEG